MMANGQFVQNNPGFNPVQSQVNSQVNYQNNMQNYNFPNTVQNVNNQSNDLTGGYNSKIQGQSVPQINVSSNDQEEVKELPAEMRLPGHMKKSQNRSNSVTPVDTNTNKYIKTSFLFDQLNPINTNQLKFNKKSSENITTPQLKDVGLDSSNSLPAIRNTSDYQSSVYSDSSYFDGNDSAAASSIDIELDANGQPVFDNMSNNGDSGSKVEGEDNSEEVPMKNRMKRSGVKKKSGFHVQARKNSVSSDGSH